MSEGGTSLKTGIYCRGCGYDLRGSNLRCPECGKLFNQANPLTFDRIPRWVRIRWWVRRIFLPLLLVALPPALGLGWLARGWKAEQEHIAALKVTGWDVQRVRPLYPWLPKCLPSRWACLADRADHVFLRGRPAEGDPQRIARLTQVREINMEDSSGITNEHLERLGKLPWLEALWVHRCPGITDEGLAHLSASSRMQMLTLWDSSITGSGLKHLKAMPLLWYLSLTNSQFDDNGAAFLSELRGLEYLDLSYARITDAGMEHLSRLTEMRRLYLSGTKISDEGLRHLAGMKKLERLILCSTAVTDAGLEHLRGLPQLRVLNVQDTRVTPAGMQRLQAALPQLDAGISPPTPAPAAPAGDIAR